MPKANNTKKTNPTCKCSNSILLVVATAIITALVIYIGCVATGQWLSGQDQTTAKTTKSIDKTETKKKVVTSNELLKVTAPTAYQKISSPVTVSGESNFFEAQTNIKVTDSNGLVLTNTYTSAEGWMDKLYPFSRNVYYKKPTAKDGTVEIFEYSAQDASETNKITIPVYFADYQVVKSYRLNDTLAAYEFAYPDGWHASSIWPTDLAAPISIAIDPNPINGAPRGGPLSTILISDWSGFENPDEVFEEKLTETRDLIVGDLEEKTSTNDFGTVYHLTGLVEYYEEQAPYETYLFMIPGSTPNNQNKHIIKATLETYKDEHSEVLQKVVESFDIL